MVVMFWKTVKSLISNRDINKDDDISLSNDGEIVNNTNYIFLEYSIIILRTLLIA